MRFKTGILKTVNKLPSFDNFSLLQVVSTLHPDVNLENAYIIGEQHIVSSTFELINCLFKKGLKRENISLIGKCYSTNPYVYASMVDRGIDVSTHSLLFDPHKSYDEQYKQFVEKFFLTRLKAINAKTVAKIIVMSDGGVLNQVLQSKSSIFSSPLIGLEQTSSGYEKLKNSRLQYPIINIARSEAKLQYESPFIVRLTLERLFFSLANLGLDPKKVLIIGNGILGNLIYHRLKSDFEVEVFDSDSSKSTISRNEFENTLTQFDLILGCTGKKSLPIKYLIYSERMSFLLVFLPLIENLMLWF